MNKAEKARLEELSDWMRKGIPLEPREVTEVIAYKSMLARERQKPLHKRLWKFFYDRTFSE